LNAYSIGGQFNPYGMPRVRQKIRASSLSLGAKAIAEALIDRGREGRCFPSIKLLAEDINVKPRQAQRYVQELTASGYVHSDPVFDKNRRQTSNAYGFIWRVEYETDGRAANMTPTANTTPSPTSRKTPPRTANTTPGRAANMTYKGIQKEGIQKETSSSSSVTASPVVPEKAKTEDEDESIRFSQTPTPNSDKQEAIEHSAEDLEKLAKFMFDSIPIENGRTIAKSRWPILARELAVLAPAWSVDEIIKAFRNNRGEHGGRPQFAIWFPKVLPRIYQRWKGIAPEVEPEPEPAIEAECAKPEPELCSYCRNSGWVEDVKRVPCEHCPIGAAVKLGIEKRSKHREELARFNAQSETFRTFASHYGRLYDVPFNCEFSGASLDERDTILRALEAKTHWIFDRKRSGGEAA
jgi:hypothetical protein